ncbi:hypothetical protein C7M84_019680 [Penaeus vannamei]|uniref:Uncharacterized protein n=1 Tax=Penaeus vannamei TaxID=6689 RepID=A0A423SE40_PENVA|nr:hypothetical protein C7M84_019680 [Penaeus vannamei]
MSVGNKPAPLPFRQLTLLKGVGSISKSKAITWRSSRDPKAQDEPDPSSRATAPEPEAATRNQKPTVKQRRSPCHPLLLLLPLAIPSLQPSPPPSYSPLRLASPPSPSLHPSILSSYPSFLSHLSPLLSLSTSLSFTPLSLAPSHTSYLSILSYLSSHPSFSSPTLPSRSRLSSSSLLFPFPSYHPSLSSSHSLSHLTRRTRFPPFPSISRISSHHIFSLPLPIIDSFPSLFSSFPSSHLIRPPLVLLHHKPFPLSSLPTSLSVYPPLSPRFHPILSYLSFPSHPPPLSLPTSLSFPLFLSPSLPFHLTLSHPLVSFSSPPLPIALVSPNPFPPRRERDLDSRHEAAHLFWLLTKPKTPTRVQRSFPPQRAQITRIFLGPPDTYAHAHPGPAWATKCAAQRRDSTALHVRVQRNKYRTMPRTKSYMS